MFTQTQQPNNRQSVENLHEKAVAKHKGNKPEDALNLYLQSIKIDELQPEWIYANAITLSAQTNHYDLGLKLKQKAQKFHPESDEVTRAIALLFHKQGDEKNAVKFYQRTIELNPKQPEWLYIKLYDLLDKFERDRVETAEQIELKQLNQNDVNRSYTNNTKSEVGDRAVSHQTAVRETPQSIEHCVDLNVSELRRQMMDAAIVEQYETLLEQMICHVDGGIKEMDADALVHCLAEIKTDIHYLKTKLLNPPASVVDPQAKQNIDIEKTISFSKPIPIKCELKNRIVGSGWHAPEEHGRWMGPGTLSSVVLAYPTPGKYRLEIIVRAEAKPGLLKTLKINFGDRPLDIDLARTTNFPAVIQQEIVIPHNRHQSFLAVDLTIAETVNPQAGDVRSIGLLIEKINLIPVV